MKTDIHGKALLVQLNISSYNPTVVDKRATRQSAELNNASASELRLVKNLVPKEAIDKIAKHIRASREDHYKLTLPWSDGGMRLLPTAAWMDYTDVMTANRDIFERQVNEFCNNFSGYRDQARARLGLLFSEADFPGGSDLRSRFAFRMQWLPIPCSGDFRIALGSDEDMRDISTSVDCMVAEAAKAAGDDLAKRLTDRLLAVVDRLSDPDNIFRDSLIDGLRDLVKLVPKLNVLDDTALMEAATAVEASITVFEPQTLRDDDEARASAADAASEILRKMGIKLD